MGQSELSLRAVVAGLAIGVFLAAGNVYMGLKTGWWDAGMIPAALLGFALIKPLAQRGGLPYSPLENNVTQVTAAALASMPSAIGLLGAMPALELLGKPVSGWALGLWGLALGVFGVSLSVPLRGRYLAPTPKPFPSAVATQEVIDALHGAGARAGAKGLVGGALGSMLLTWFRDGKPSLFPSSVWLPMSVRGISGQALTLGASFSPMLLCIGTLVGPRVGLSLALGAAVAWAGVAPWLISEQGVKAEYSACVEWLLWPGVAMLVASSLTSLAMQWPELLAALRRARARSTPGQETSSGDRWAAGAAGVAVVCAAWFLFDLHPLWGATMVLVSIVLIDMCVMIAANTDVAPYGSIGQLMQLLIGAVLPGAPTTNIVGASIPSGGAVQTVQTMYGFRVGMHFRASTRRLVVAQLIGVAVGALVVVPMYLVIVKAYGLGTPALPAPFVLAWKALAEVAQRGAVALPPMALPASVLSAAVGVCLTLFERRAPRWTPSPVGLGLAFLLPAASCATIALGGVAALVLARVAPTWTKQSLTSLAAGGIVGESLMGVAIAGLLMAQVL